MILYSKKDTFYPNYPNTNRTKTTISILSREKKKFIRISVYRVKNIKIKLTSQILKHQMSHLNIEIESIQELFRH